jgi:hypothetical protein
MKLEILNPPNQISIAMELIEKIKKDNGFTFDLTLQLDYIMPEDSRCAGLYDCTKPNIIKVNPFLCLNEETFSYPEDNTIFGVIMHEFAHFLSMTYFVDFQKNYLESFPDPSFSNKGRLLITSYDAANTLYNEEIAEVISLHCRNSYLLKLISPDHHKFLNGWFKSPIPCTEKRFIYMYNQLPIKYKKKLQSKWGIMVDHSAQKVTVIKDQGKS